MRPSAMTVPCLAAVLSIACTGDTPPPPASPAAASPVTLDVTLVGSLPAAGGTLFLARAATASLAQGGAQVLGKRFNVSFALQCR